MQKELTVEELILSTKKTKIILNYPNGEALKLCLSAILNDNLDMINNIHGCGYRVLVSDIYDPETLSAGSLGPRPTVSIYHEDELLDHNGLKEEDENL